MSQKLNRGRVFEKKITLNQAALEKMDAYDKWNLMKDNQEIKPIIEYYLKNKLHINPQIFTKFQTRGEFETYLYQDKENLISEKEQIEEARKFASEILNLEMLHLETKTNAKTKCLILTRKIGLTKKQCEDMFDGYIPMDYSKHIEFFVDKYMRKNVKLFVSMIKQENFTVTLSNMSKGEICEFDLNFNIKIDDLDEVILSNIGKILSNCPNFA